MDRNETAERGDGHARRRRLSPLAKRIFDERYLALAKRTDRMFAVLLIAQWAGAVSVAVWLSPYAWSGMERVVHGHVYAAVFVGGAITSLPLVLALRQTGATSTRYVIAVGQVLWSALLIHLTGGRIETHFHVFGSLAFIAFYRDLRVLVPATTVVVLDHFVRGMYWPESVYGVSNPEWWRFLEHAGWVAFLDVFLIMNCVQTYRDLEDLAARQAEADETREALVRTERLAAIGQLAASVGHELRNPLAAVRNAHTYVARRLAQEGMDARIEQFMGIMKHELEESSRIISNLLDFSRPRDVEAHPCPLRPLVDEAITLLPALDGVEVVNSIADDLPAPEIDKDQFRQILLNLMQNAAEAMPKEQRGVVDVGAAGGGTEPWRITVSDNGPGIAPEHQDKIFQPLFTTKTKGTGLGLAIVRSMVERHHGELYLSSEVGKGATFTIELPPGAPLGAE